MRRVVILVEKGLEEIRTGDDPKPIECGINYHKVVCKEKNGRDRVWYHSTKEDAVNNHNDAIAKDPDKKWYRVPVKQKADGTIVEIGDPEPLPRRQE